MNRRSVICHAGFLTGLLAMSTAIIAEIGSQWSPPVRLSAIRLVPRDDRPLGSPFRPGDEATLEKWGHWHRLCAGEAVETITDRMGKPWEGRKPRVHPIKTPPKVGPITTGPRPQPWVVPSDIPDGEWMVTLDPRMWCWPGERLMKIKTPQVQAPFTVRR